MKISEKRSHNKLDRRAIEKNRRIEMKALCSKLVSLVPEHHFKPAKRFLPQQEQLNQVVDYIKDTRERIQELKREKKPMNSSRMENDTKNGETMSESELPIMEIKDLGSDLEVVLIRGPNKTFRLHRVISIIEEEGAQVVNLSIATIGDKIFHTLHAQVKFSRVGVDTSRISERIHELIS